MNPYHKAAIGLAFVYAGLLALAITQRGCPDVGPDPLPPVAEAYVIAEKDQFVTRDIWFGNDPYRNERLIHEYFNNQSNVLFVVIKSRGPIKCRRR